MQGEGRATSKKTRRPGQAVAYVLWGGWPWQHSFVVPGSSKAYWTIPVVLVPVVVEGSARHTGRKKDLVYPSLWNWSIALPSTSLAAASLDSDWLGLGTYLGPFLGYPSMSTAFTPVFPFHTFYSFLLSADGQEAQEADLSTGQGLPYNPWAHGARNTKC